MERWRAARAWRTGVTLVCEATVCVRCPGGLGGVDLGGDLVERELGRRGDGGEREGGGEGEHLWVLQVAGAVFRRRCSCRLSVTQLQLLLAAAAGQTILH